MVCRNSSLLSRRNTRASANRASFELGYLNPKTPSSIERVTLLGEIERCAKTTNQIRLELGITRPKRVRHICSEKEEAYGLVPIKANSQRSFRTLKLDKKRDIPCIPRGRGRERISISSTDRRIAAIEGLALAGGAENVTRTTVKTQIVRRRLITSLLTLILGSPWVCGLTALPSACGVPTVLSRTEKVQGGVDKEVRRWWTPLVREFLTQLRRSGFARTHLRGSPPGCPRATRGIGSCYSAPP